MEKVLIIGYHGNQNKSLCKIDKLFVKGILILIIPVSLWFLLPKIVKICTNNICFH